MKKKGRFDAVISLSVSGEECDATLEEFCSRLAKYSSYPPGIGLVLFFCSEKMVTDAFTTVLNSHFSTAVVVGMVTRNQHQDAGSNVLGSCTLVAALFERGHFNSCAALIPELHNFELGEGYEVGRLLTESLAVMNPRKRQFGIVLMDSSAKEEERVAQELQVGAGEEVPLVGGAAAQTESGECLFFKGEVESEYQQGRFYRDAALLVLLSTDIPFYCFSNHYWGPLEKALVVTDSLAHERIIREIDGLPAVEALSRYLHLDIDRFERTPSTVSLCLKQQRGNFMRTVMRVLPDGSLVMGSAVEDGALLNLVERENILQKTEALVNEVTREVGGKPAVIGFNSIYLQKMVYEEGVLGSVRQQLNNTKMVVGGTVGEQLLGMHLNSTFTGVAFATEGMNGRG